MHAYGKQISELRRQKLKRAMDVVKESEARPGASAKSGNQVINGDDADMGDDFHRPSTQQMDNPGNMKLHHNHPNNLRASISNAAFIDWATKVTGSAHDTYLHQQQGIQHAINKVAVRGATRGHHLRCFPKLDFKESPGRPRVKSRPGNQRLNLS